MRIAIADDFTISLKKRVRVKGVFVASFTNFMNEFGLGFEPKVEVQFVRACAKVDVFPIGVKAFIKAT